MARKTAIKNKDKTTMCDSDLQQPSDTKQRLLVKQLKVLICNV